MRNSWFRTWLALSILFGCSSVVRAEGKGHSLGEVFRGPGSVGRAASRFENAGRGAPGPDPGAEHRAELNVAEPEFLGDESPGDRQVDPIEIGDRAEHEQPEHQNPPHPPDGRQLRLPVFVLRGALSVERFSVQR